MEDIKATDNTPNSAGSLFRDLLNELTEELTVLDKGRDKSELTQAERRMRIRSTFATIEALTYVWKQIALAAHPNPQCSVITEAERAFAQEQEFRLTETGDVEIRRTKISLEANLRFAHKLLAKSCSITSELDVSRIGWQSLKRAIKIRDRITHPKHVSDVTISAEEYTDVKKAFKWVLISHVQLYAEILKQRERELREDLKSLDLKRE